VSNAFPPRQGLASLRERLLLLRRYRFIIHRRVGKSDRKWIHDAREQAAYLRDLVVWHSVQKQMRLLSLFSEV